LPKVLKPPRGSSRGAGGDTEAVVGRIGALRIGSLTMSSPIVSLSRERAGADADPDSAGIVGSTVWRRFVLTIDYGGKRMWLAKNETFDQPSTHIGTGILWGRSGASGKGDLVVRGLMEGAPGAEAGLVVGDILLSLDGRAAGDLTLSSIEDVLHDAGKPRRLVVRRGDHELTLTVTPRDLL
jgi:hypothetical protein